MVANAPSQVCTVTPAGEVESAFTGKDPAALRVSTSAPPAVVPRVILETQRAQVARRRQQCEGKAERVAEQKTEVK